MEGRETMVWGIILVPLDGSPLAERALPYADALARATGASLTLMTAIEHDQDGMLARLPALRERLEHGARDQAAQYLERSAALLRAWGRTVSTLITGGRPAEEILDAAERLDAALIAMATHGRGGLQRWLVGSVADKVMRLSPRPTLLVRPAEEQGPLQPLTLSRLMVPLDGSPLAEQALTPAVEVAHGAGARLLLVRVEPWVATTLAATGEAAALVNVDELETAVAREAEQYLADVRGRLPADLPVETAVLRGFPALELIAYAERERVDLTVMSTHGRGGLERLVLGSTADRLVRAGLPCLLVRPTQP